jgi:hypothetical protein
MSVSPAPCLSDFCGSLQRDLFDFTQQAGYNYFNSCKGFLWGVCSSSRGRLQQPHRDLLTFSLIRDNEGRDGCGKYEEL